MDNSELHIAALSDIGKKRKNNEDSAYVATTPYGTLLIAADGMGGHRKGEVASKIVVDSLSIPFMTFHHKFKSGNSKRFLSKNLKKANKEIYKMSLSGDEFREMGTTAVAALVFDSGTYLLSVGDSRCYSFKDNVLTQQTKDQTYVEMLFETGRIKKSEIATHPQKNLLLNAVGINPDLVDVEEKVIPNDYDALMLCTDGLYNMLNESEMSSVLRENVGAHEKAQKLIDLALEHGGNDNIAVVLLVK